MDMRFGQSHSWILSLMDETPDWHGHGEHLLTNADLLPTTTAGSECEISLAQRHLPSIFHQPSRKTQPNLPDSRCCLCGITIVTDIACKRS